jgi:hypothetical protein
MSRDTFTFEAVDSASSEELAGRLLEFAPDVILQVCFRSRGEEEGGDSFRGKSGAVSIGSVFLNGAPCNVATAYVHNPGNGKGVSYGALASCTDIVAKIYREGRYAVVIPSDLPMKTEALFAALRTGLEGTAEKVCVLRSSVEVRGTAPCPVRSAYAADTPSKIREKTAAAAAG